MRTLIQAPQANAIAERFVRTVRSECLDWVLIVSARHLERILTVFIDHYDRHRAHRGLNLTPPDGRPAISVHPNSHKLTVVRQDRLGGLLHEYRCAA